jgi:phage recombination protein Bet
MNDNSKQLVQTESRTGLVTRFAGRYGVEAGKLLATLKATAFRQPPDKPEVSNEQMMALLVVADQYRLNPFTREIFAFADRAGIVPVVSVDGWARIMNEEANFDGVEFVDGPEVEGVPEWIEAVIYRKDRSHPTRVRERYREVKRSTIPWQTHPARMTRHKAMIQCARIAFGFAGIYDEDEAQRIIEAQVVNVADEPPKGTTVERIKHKVRAATAKSAENEAVDPDLAPYELTFTPLTFAEVADAINKAKTAEQVDDFDSIINAAIADATQRVELHDLAKARRVELK